MVSVVAGNVFLWFPSLVFKNGFHRGRKTCFYGFRRRIFDGFCRRRRVQNLRTYRVIPRFLWFLGLVSVAGFFMVSVVAGKHFLFVLFMVSVVGCFMVSVVAGNVSFCIFSFMVSVVFFFLFKMVSGCYRTAALSRMETVKKKHQGVSVTN